MSDTFTGKFGIDFPPDPLRVIAEALRDIADAMIERNKLDRARFEKQYPLRPPPRDALVTYVKSPESEIKADQQGEDAETDLEDWLKLKEAGYLQSPDEGEGSSS